MVKKKPSKVTCNSRKTNPQLLFGPSGCGKSTFLRSLNRMNDTVCTKVTGQILYQGVDVSKVISMFMKMRKHIGMVFNVQIHS